ncbi:MAG: ribosomal protein S18-alanine N-acetyltransferase [Rhodocyclaceae bacterium]|nr:ribosomal protein S18-alanine N-acetyltransferase [Rhodocyclaceae bacterium]
MGADDLEWVMAHEVQLYPFPWSRGNFADSLGAGYLCRVMLDDATPIGYAVLMVVLDEAHLLNFSVILTAQRRGAGAAMLAHLRDELRALGVLQLFLEVRPSNTPALALYTASGFASIGRRQSYYPACGGREDAIVMRVTP